MKTCLKTSFLTFLIITIATAYELPEVIGVLEEEGIFATDFCWVGDQNDDGFDDLLVRYSAGNQALLYYGDEQMENEPGFIFEPYLEQQDICHGMSFTGHLLPNRNEYVAIYGVERCEPPRIITNLYECGDNIDNEPDFSLSRVYRDNSIFFREGFRTRPTDVNGDGNHDFIAFKEVHPAGHMLIFHGGEDFDTIPDWIKYMHNPINLTPTILFSSGYDINSDGFDDILVKTRQPRENSNQLDYWYSLYLGGSPMDTVPVFSFREDHFEGRIEQRRMIHGFSLLPDVNDDGYDDWGIYWSEDEDDGFFIFFGGEEPDMEPDLELEGHRRLWRGNGGLTGGDFNGDGIGDIVTRLHAGNPMMNEIHIHLGSRWMDGETDIYIDLDNAYRGQYAISTLYIGAVGDYNGDDVDDFVVSGAGSAIVFAGNRDWERGIDSNQSPDTYKLSLQTIPNPFNSQINISYNMTKTDLVRLSVYDIQGRLIDILEDRMVIRGKHRIVWNHRTAGLYFICLQAGDSKIVKKVVCIP